MQFLKTIRSNAKTAAGVALVTLAPFAHAGGGFTLPAELTAALAAVAVVGAGVFAIKVGIKVYKWYSNAL